MTPHNPSLPAGEQVFDGESTDGDEATPHAVAKSSTMALQRVGGPVWDTRLGLEVVGSPKLAPVATSPPPHPGGHAEPVDVDTMAQSLRECGLLRVVERPSCSDTHITVGVSVQMVSKAGYLWTKPMSQLPSVTFSSGSTQPIAQLVLEQVRLPGRIVQPRPFKLCGVDMFTVQGELISDVVTPAELCWCDPPSAFILRATYRDGVETLKYLGGRVADARGRNTNEVRNANDDDDGRWAM